MKYAIVESGGKQYKAVEGDVIQVDRLQLEAGDQLTLDAVLLMVDGDQIQVGTPNVEGASVSTTVVNHIKGPKVIIFNYRPKKHFRVKTGHRQNYTLLKVDSIKE
jgi:large subunit ribosomal protein L21